MTYSNPAFFANLQDVITDDLYRGSSAQDLQDEIRHNMSLISASQEDALRLTIEDFTEFFGEVIQNRIDQLRKFHNQGMIFYLWFDRQACQLRFCLISNVHASLPFGNPISLVERPETIFEQFLGSPYHDGIPFTELQIMDIADLDDQNAVTITSPTLVYKTLLP
jgi:hypothetical protein